MKEIAAVIVCAIVVGIYSIALYSLDLLEAMCGPDSSVMERIVATTPLLLLIGVCWSAITGRAFPKTLDPFGIVTSRSSRPAGSEGIEEKSKA